MVFVKQVRVELTCPPSDSASGLDCLNIEDFFDLQQFNPFCH